MITKISSVCSDMEVKEVITGIHHVEPRNVVVIFPKEIKNHPIFRSNIEHVIQDAEDLISELHQLKHEEELLKCLKFQSEIDRQKEICENHQKKFMEISDRMNDGIAPYYWVVNEDFDAITYGYQIKADYLIILVKGE